MFDGKLYSFRINWLIYASVIAAVFAVIGLTMLLSTGSIRNDNIIEALKEDAI